MSTNIYSIGLSGLQAAQAAIATAGENISNSSTPGYDEESTILSESTGQNTGSGYIGSGVTVSTVQRAYSQYLATALNNAQSTNSAITASYTLATDLSNLVGSSTSGIGSSITAFFSGLEDVSNSPDDTATRQSAVSDAGTLAGEINAAGAQYDSIRTSVNTQLTDAVSQVNTYAQQIAQLNAQITSASATGTGDAPNQLLDERDADVSSLSQLIGTSVVQNTDGTYSVFLGSGQPLVVGSQSYSLTTQPSSTNPSELTVAWESNSSGSSSSSASSTEPLTSAALQGGTIGGLVSYVTQTLDPAEAQLGAIATSFAAQVNQQNALGLTQAGGQGGALFSVNPTEVYANSANTGSATVSVSLTDPTSPPTDNYTLSYAGGTYTLTDTTTNTSVTTTTAPTSTTPWDVDGLSISIGAGAMNDGDSFSIEPTAGALDSFSVASGVTAASIAAATPALVSASTSNTGSATVSDTSVSAGYTVPSSPTTLTYTANTTGSGGTLSGFAVGSVVTVTDPGTSTSTTYTIDGTDTTSIPYDPSTGAE
ncbi:MAG TPA: flagellar hook-associated protein FlgK, partial [Paraburkholderia sp.]